MKIPVRNSESKKQDELLSFFLGKQVESGIKVKVVEEKSVNIEEYCKNLIRIAETFTTNKGTHADIDCSKNDEHELLTSENVKNVEKNIHNEVHKDEFENQRLQRIKQLEREKKKVNFLIILAIITFLAIYMFLMSHSKNDTDYDYYEPELEFRHT